MPRVKRGTMTHKRHKKVLERAKGFWGGRSRLFKTAKDRLEAGCRRASSYAALRETLEGAGGFVFAPWCGSPECEARISEETKATIRLVPDEAEEGGPCVLCGKGPARYVPFARSY